MVNWNKLRVLPPAAQINQLRTFSATLVGVLGFIVVVRGLALVQFLVDLDYSEVNQVRLIQFVFLKIIIFGFLIYYMRLLWTRPHRLALFFLIFLCMLSLYHYRDVVSVFSSVTIGAVTFLLYLKLYPKKNEEPKVALPSQDNIQVIENTSPIDSSEAQS